MTKKLRKKKQRIITFPRGIKFMRFGFMNDKVRALEHLTNFLEAHVRPSMGSFIVGSGFIKYLPKNGNAAEAWQVSTIAGKQIVLYHFNKTLNLFTSQGFQYLPEFVELVEKYVKRANTHVIVPVEQESGEGVLPSNQERSEETESEGLRTGA